MIPQVLGARVPVDEELSLPGAVAYPVKAHVDRL